MFAGELVQILNDQGPLNIVSDPFMEVIINSFDRNNIIPEDVTQWSRSQTCDQNTWQGHQYVSLPSSSSADYVDLTKTVVFPSSGLYQLEVLAQRSTTCDWMELYVDGVLIENRVSLKHDWQHWHYVFYHAHKYSKGSHTITIRAAKSTPIVEFMAKPIRQFIGDSEGTPRNSSRRLDIQTAEFTENTIGDIGTLNLKVAMKDDFIDTENPDSGFMFEFTDPITVLIGEDRKSIIPKWGGYILGPVPDKEALQINAVDRLVDLERQQLFNNFLIGTASTTDSTNTLTNISFSNIFQFAKYMSETSEYGIPTDEINEDYGFKLNFANIDEVDNLYCSGAFAKSFDMNWGYPKPSLKFTLSGKTGEGVLTLFNSANTWDAAIYNYLDFHYCFSRVSLDNPVPFNVVVYMYKANETYAQAQKYVIDFTQGYDVDDCTIGSVKPVYSGDWELFHVDLKSLFDNMYPSTEYNITKIELRGTVTQGMLDQNKCRTVWIDNPLSYDEVNSAPNYSAQDVKTPYEQLQDMHDQNGLVVYVKPGIERCDDRLIVIPEENNISEEYILEGRNLLEISNYVYDPRSDGICNYAIRTYHPASDSDDTTTKSEQTYYADKKSIFSRGYGPWQKYEDLSDVTNDSDALKNAQTYVTANSRPKKSFTAKIFGSTLVWPEEYIDMLSKTYRITGSHKIKTITHNYDENGDYRFTSAIDLNAPSAAYLKKQRALKRSLANFGIKYSASSFRQYGLAAVGSDSPGGIL